MKVPFSRVISMSLALLLAGEHLHAYSFAPKQRPPSAVSFEEQAFSVRGLWYLAPLAVGIAAYCFQDAHAAGNVSLAAVTFLPTIKIKRGRPWAWPGESALYEQKIDSTPELKEKLLNTWMIGSGNYGARQVSSSYPFLLSPVQEHKQLLILQGKVKTASRSLSKADLTTSIGNLRLELFANDLENPKEFQKWAKAISLIEEQLNTIEKNWGQPYRQTLERMILELEASLPFTGDPKRLDTYKHFVTETDHGLLHSLAVIDLALHFVKANGEEARLEEAKAVYAGIGLYHDLTGLRGGDARKDHHLTASFLAKMVLPQFRNPDGSPVYSHELIQEIALGCENHRGQTFPEPVGFLQKNFVDADEYSVVVDLLRVFKQAAYGGISSHKFWDIYRRYIINEDFQLGAYKAGMDPKEIPKFRQETKWADLFQYVFFTLVMRTKPESYHTHNAKDTVEKQYPTFKFEALQEIKKQMRIRGGVLQKTLWEQRSAIRLMQRQITEMEVWHRNDDTAKEKIVRAMGGSPEAFVAMLEDYLTQVETVHAAKYEKAREMLVLAYHQESAREPSLSGRTILEKPEFKSGLEAFNKYLENPWVSLTQKLDKKHSSHKSSRYAGFAHGIYLASRDRMRDLWSLVTPDPTQPLPAGLEYRVSHAISQYFFDRLIAGYTLKEAADATRQQLRIFNIKTDEPLVLHMRTRFELGILQYFRSYPTSDTHIHGSGALSYDEIAELCTRFREHVHMPKIQEAHPDFDPTNADHWRRFSYQNGVESNKSFEKPFEPIKELLANDKEFVIHEAWYEKILLNAHKEGNRFIAITSTFDAFKDEETFRKAVMAAIRGLRAAEQKTGGAIRGALILGLRKEYSEQQAQNMIRLWQDLKHSLSASDSLDAARLLGIDSVGYDADTFDVQAIRRALDSVKGQWKKVHMGEMWLPGKLKLALEQLKAIVDSGEIDQITNPIALFVSLDPRRAILYSEEERKQIAQLQQEIIDMIKRRGIVVEISPRSNEHNSFNSRMGEGWSFTPLAKMLEQLPENLVLTDDDPGIFDTTYAEEYLLILLGKTAYGAVDQAQIQQLLDNSYRLMQRIRERFPSLEIPAAIPPQRPVIQSRRLQQSA